jgi:N-acetylmuramoyl-L-alanine amidase
VLLKKSICLFLVLILFFGGIPSNAHRANAESVVKIAIDSLNVREGPGLSYRVVKQVTKGESFQVVKEENDWIQIKLPNNEFGWVANWLIQMENKVDGSTKSETGIVIVDGLRVRNGPGISFQTIGHISKGLEVRILEKNENWLKISTSEVEGWVSDEFVQLSNVQAPDNSTDSKTTTNTTATVTVDGLNIRSDAMLTASIIGRAQKGEKLEVISSTKDWVQINYQGQNAWISAEFVQIDSSSSTIEDSKESPKPSSSKNGIVGTVTANALNIRSKPDLSGSIVGSVTKGKTFVILEEKNNWSKIEFSSKKYGWINTWYLEKSIPKSSSSKSQQVKESFVTILYDGTNIRKGASVQTSVAIRANEGEQFPIKSLIGEWYEIVLKDGSSAYIAGWIVSVSGSAPQVEKPGAAANLKNKTIILDPGHGGGDNGTTGSRGTLEKELTLRTALLLNSKLRAAGAKVILTRTSDSYFSLRSRVSTAHYHNADAFISIHYDSILDRSVRGMTTYYYHSFQRPLAEAIHSATIAQTKIKDRGARLGDYHVLRENNQRAILLELGYLSNPTEETIVSNPQYQEMAATGIFNGLAKFFKSDL